METAELILDIDDLTQKHRQEKKELQSRITSLKKTVPKNDKKKKKEIQDTIEKLEKEMNDRQKEELEAINGHNGDKKIQPVEVEEEAPNNNQINNENEEDVSDSKMTRAQRRRLKKENEDKERNKRISEQEKLNKSGPRTVELNTIKEMLVKQGLQLYNVAADGNCLYCSITHQLDVTGREVLDINELRLLTANFMRENKDDFIPFMCNDSDELLDEVQFEKYCREVERTKLWGGQLELKALSNVLRCPIKIIQASGPATIQGEQFDGKPLVITYHRHMYRLGEHYNSTMVAPLVEPDDNVEES